MALPCEREKMRAAAFCAEVQRELKLLPASAARRGAWKEEQAAEGQGTHSGCRFAAFASCGIKAAVLIEKQLPGR